LFIGKLFGKHKLCPALSPNKTVEGFLGGLFVGSVVLVVMVALVDVFVETVSPNYIMVAITAIVTTVVSQAGDLSFSAIKRDAQIKDFSRLLPGHGGVLDRFDSTFAVSFALLFLLNFHRLF
jgi:phosphatidate cytidylyltransferase